MKKALVVLLALVCLSAAAFADSPVASWTVTGLYGFGIYSPSVGNSILAYDYSQVGTNRTRLDFKYTSADGNAGFINEMQYVNLTNTTLGTMTFTRWLVWGKMFNGLLTVRAGQLDDYSVATLDWNNFGTTDGEDNYVGPGVSFMLTPMDGLKILFFQQIPTGGGATPLTMNGDLIGAAYAIPNLVSVQVGAILNNSYTAAVGTKPYFGFGITAVPGLTAILEGQVSLLNGSTPIQLEQNIAYAMGPLTVGARIGEYSNSGLDWGVEPTVTYKVDGNLAVNAIVNIYDFGNATGGTAGKVTFMSPIDAGAVGAGDAATMNFGAGASLTYTMSGFTLTAGDYYGAGNGSGNIIYINADLTL